METCKLIYDAECPLCKAYTAAFQKHGLLDEDERISFQEAESQGLLRHVNMKRGRHKIPFVNTATGNILYGVDALGAVLGRRWPWMGRAVQHPVIHWLAAGLYTFVSYNRRIIPIIRRKASQAYYGPDLHTGYRMAYMLITALAAILISYRLGQHLCLHYPFQHFTGRIMVATVGLGWVNQLMLSRSLLRRNDWWDYAGHLCTTMLIGVLVLVPYLTIDAFIFLPAWAGWAAMGISCLVMCQQQWKRLKAIGLPLHFFISWFLSLFLFFGLSLLYFQHV